MSTLPRNFPTTAATVAVDDYVQLDGATNGSRKFLASLWATLASPIFTGTPKAPTPNGTEPKALVTVDYNTGVTLPTATADATSKANAAQAYAIQRAYHTGTQSADTLTDGTTNKAFLATERIKLAGIETGATANQSDTYLLNRGNHSGTQPVSTITGLGGIATANYFASSEITPVANSRVSVTHNFGGVPTLVTVVLRCKAVDNDYPVGQEITIGSDYSAGSNAVVVSANSTNVECIIYAGVYMANYAGTAGMVLDLSKWKLVFRAWCF